MLDLAILKVKITAYATGSTEGSRGTDPLFLNLGTEGGGWSTPRFGRFILDKGPRYPM
jgi:hypothetical protein